MCSFSQSVTLNQSGKEEFQRKASSGPGKAWGLVENGGRERSVETKEEEERRITTALRFRAMNGTHDLLRGISGVRERGENKVSVVLGAEENRPSLYVRC